MNELVKINTNNQVTTDSLIVADRFGKRHCDVLRSIKTLKCSKEFGLRNFTSSVYINEQGKEQPYYDMTRDGWMFLVMGFTGAKAAEWKEEFIAAFNALEATVSKMEIVPVPVDMKAIGGMVKKCCAAAVRQELAGMLDKFLASGESYKSVYPTSDDDLIKCLWSWYATHHKKTFDAMQEITAENDQLKCKLLRIKQAVN